MKICIVRNVSGEFFYASGSEASFFLKLNNYVENEIWKMRSRHELIHRAYASTPWFQLPVRGSYGERILLCRGIGKTYYDPWARRLIRISGKGEEYSDHWHPEQDAPEFCVYTSRWLENSLIIIWESFWKKHREQETAPEGLLD